MMGADRSEGCLKSEALHQRQYTRQVGGALEAGKPANLNVCMMLGMQDLIRTYRGLLLGHCLAKGGARIVLGVRQQARTRVHTRTHTHTYTQTGRQLFDNFLKFITEGEFLQGARSQQTAANAFYAKLSTCQTDPY
eukprot:scaffold228173_cov18-Tisochrysis_lutea.AAC.1